MADGVSITPGSGAVVATDEKNFGAGPVQAQLVAIVSAEDGNTNRGKVNANGELQVALGGLTTALKVTNVGLVQNATAVNPTPVPLANRASVAIFNESDVTIRLGTASTVTATSPNRGVPIYSGQQAELDIGSVAFFLFAPTGGAAGAKDVTILELA